MKFVLALLVLFLFDHINGQIYWEKIYDNLSYESNIRPVPRRDAAIAYDIGRNRIIIFGGWQTNTDNFHYRIPVLLDDTWEYDLNTRIWRQLSYSSNRPSPRYGMLYSHNKYGLYISSGRSWFEEYYNDLWVYDFREDLWYKMDQTFISIIPEARYSPIGGIYPSYEFGDELRNNFFLSMGRAQYVMYDNMYVYQFTDIRGLNGIWDYVYTNIFSGPFSFTQPHARSFASSTMISQDELLLFGGCLSGSFAGGPCPSSDSWLFSYINRNWERVESACMAPRSYSAMASIMSDGYRKAAVMFSGLTKDNTILAADEESEDEVLIFDNLGKRWIKRKVQGFYFPEKRNGHVMCSGRYRNEFGVFLFGGHGHSSNFNLADLWFLKINMTTAFDYRTQTSFQKTYSQRQTNCSNYFSLIHLHAIFMFVGWIVFINISTLISKYLLKPDDNKYRSLRSCNRVLKPAGIILITAGIVLGFWSSHGFPNLIHLSVGLVAYLFVILEPISAYIKLTRKTHYYLDESDRNQFNSCQNLYSSIYKILNKNLSITALLFACINISLGVLLAVFEWYWVLIWFFILGINIAVYIVLEANKYFNKLNANKPSEQNSQKSNIYNQDGSMRSARDRDCRSNSSIYNRDDISMDYLDNQRKRLNSGSTCYSNNNSSRVSTINIDYALKRPTNPPSVKNDEFYVSNKEFLQSGVLSYSQMDKAYFKNVEIDN